MNIQCKRVYDPAEQSDGYRILVDRLWPRGIKKTDLALDEWDKEITPSTELRKAFHGEVVDFATFREQYLAELAQHEQEGKRLADIAKKQPLTLLYAAKTPRRTMRWCWPTGYVACDFSTASGGYFSPAGWSRRHNAHSSIVSPPGNLQLLLTPCAVDTGMSVPPFCWQ